MGFGIWVLVVGVMGRGNAWKRSFALCLNPAILRQRSTGRRGGNVAGRVVVSVAERRTAAVAGSMAVTAAVRPDSLRVAVGTRAMRQAVVMGQPWLSVMTGRLAW